MHVSRIFKFRNSIPFQQLEFEFRRKFLLVAISFLADGNATLGWVRWLLLRRWLCDIDGDLAIGGYLSLTLGFV
jgi:hypothetical protein